MDCAAEMLAQVRSNPFKIWLLPPASSDSQKRSAPLAAAEYEKTEVRTINPKFNLTKKIKKIETLWFYDSFSDLSTPGSKIWHLLTSDSASL